MKSKFLNMRCSISIPYKHNTTTSRHIPTDLSEVIREILNKHNSLSLPLPLSLSLSPFHTSLCPSRTHSFSPSFPHSHPPSSLMMLNSLTVHLKAHHNQTILIAIHYPYSLYWYLIQDERVSLLFFSQKFKDLIYFVMFLFLCVSLPACFVFI